MSTKKTQIIFMKYNQGSHYSLKGKLKLFFHIRTSLDFKQKVWPEQMLSIPRVLLI